VDFLSTIFYHVIAHQVISPLVARYSLFDSIYARLGVVRAYLIRNCCSGSGLSWHESFCLFISIC